MPGGTSRARSSTAAAPSCTGRSATRPTCPPHVLETLAQWTTAAPAAARAHRERAHRVRAARRRRAGRRRVRRRPRARDRPPLGRRAHVARVGDRARARRRRRMSTAFFAEVERAVRAAGAPGRGIRLEARPGARALTVLRCGHGARRRTLPLDHLGRPEAAARGIPRSRRARVPAGAARRHIPAAADLAADELLDRLGRPGRGRVRVRAGGVPRQSARHGARRPGLHPARHGRRLRRAHDAAQGRRATRRSTSTSRTCGRSRRLRA